MINRKMSGFVPEDKDDEEVQKMIEGIKKVMDME